MLYPIELLGQMTAIGLRGTATDGVHVNGRVRFCHVVRGLFECRPILANAIVVQPCKHRHMTPSCRMHYDKMPALQIAIRQPPKVDSTI
ncbi:hypothetical protein PspCFBP13506_26135 [Pseudomonas sp. CFBP13506]|nr:hypothetical protein PspCFBP13506_26135 [Pseudomonas sp. CFBP13506]